MSKETLRMQMLAGVITESEYKTELQENLNDLKVEWTPEYYQAIKNYGDEAYDEKGLTDNFKMRNIDGKNIKVKEIIGYYVPEGAKNPNDEEFDIIGYIYSTSGKDIESYSDDELDDVFMNALENPKKLNETQLNENFVGIGMVGNIFDRKKTDYEIAFEHYAKGNSLTGLGLEENYRDEEFASDIRRNLGYDEEYKNPTTMSPEELQQFKDSAKKDELGENEVDDTNFKDNLIKAIATLQLELDKDKNSKYLDPESLPRLQKTIDLLSATLKGTNGGKEVEEPDNY